MADEREGPKPVAPVVSGPDVTDDDRDRYGRLLDRAAERGLLGPYDYEVRLRDLASASTIDQMNQIVTELPVFTPAPSTGTVGAGSRGSRGRVTGPSVGPSSAHRTSPWLLLVIVVVVVAALVVVLSLYATHLVRQRNTGLAPTSVPAVSAPRP